jgi:Zn-dependent protease
VPKTVTFLLQAPILLFAIVLHETAHAWAALWKGDTTARDAGRLTLNPLPHLDPIGSILVPLLLFVSQGFAPRFLVGWAKPVPVDPHRLRRGRRDLLFVALAGPASNLLLAGLSSVGLGMLYRFGIAIGGGALNLMLQYGIVMNCVLAVFNLIPIPPLDGASVILHVLPPDAARRYASLQRYALPVLLLLMIAGGGRVLLAPASWMAGGMFALSAAIAG